MMYEQMNDMSDLDLLTPCDTPRRPQHDRTESLNRFQAGDGRLNDSEQSLAESLMPEFDRVLNRYQALSQDQGKIERGYLKLCQIVQHEQKQWQQQQHHIKCIEKENGLLSRELNVANNKLKQSEAVVEAKVDKCHILEKQLEEMQEAFELMSEIVFDDELEVSSPRRAQIEEIKSSFKRNAKIHSESEESTVSRNTTREPSLCSVSEQESELNAAYGDMYTAVSSRNRRAKEWVSSAPVPSARAAPPRPAQPPHRPTTPINSAQNTPIKSAMRQSPNRCGTPGSMKKLSFIEPPSFVADFTPDSGDIYQSATPPKSAEIRDVEMLPAVDGMPLELVLYVSALSNKLGHPDLYVTSPETEEVNIIENLKELVRNVRLDEKELLRELNTKSTNVLCQLVKDFFNDNGEKLLNAQSSMMQLLMQAVRCCNDGEIMRLIRSLPAKKQIQMAFLIRHLQSAVDAGRLPGELAGAFGCVIVTPGSKNRNDCDELCEKLIQLPAEFYTGLMETEVINEDQTDETKEGFESDSSYCSMLGPVKTAAGLAATGAKWKKMIEERRHRLLANCDIKLFTTPKT